MPVELTAGVEASGMGKRREPKPCCKQLWARHCSRFAAVTVLTHAAQGFTSRSHASLCPRHKPSTRLSPKSRADLSNLYLCKDPARQNPALMGASASTATLHAPLSPHTSTAVRRGLKQLRVANLARCPLLCAVCAMPATAPPSPPPPMQPAAPGSGRDPPGTDTTCILREFCAAL